MSLNDDQRHALAAFLASVGEDAAAEVLRQGVRETITLPVDLADTRDGREEAIAALQEAFETPPVACFVIERYLRV